MPACDAGCGPEHGGDEVVIAAAMRDEAKASGQARRTLDGGLILTLSCRGETYSLSLTRQYRQSSETERDICRAAFGVPAWVGTRHTTVEYVDGWGIWRTTWSESRGHKIRAISQGHLEIGLSAWRTLLAKYNCYEVSDWDKLSDAQLDEMIKEVFNEH